MTAWRKLIATAVLIAAAVVSVPASSYAEGAYRGYIYNNLEDTPASLNGYLHLDFYDGVGTETGPLKGPEDLFVAPDDTIYVVDGGNNRVLRLDRQDRVLAVYGSAEGASKLNGPKGVFVTEDGTVYVADTLNRRIVAFDEQGAVVKELGLPDSPLLGKDFVYSPSKLIVDKRGYLFVVSDGSTGGLMQIKPDGSFAGFFGANHIGFDWTRSLVRLMATEEQKRQMASKRPPEFSNVFQDSEGFIFTTTLGIEANQIKRLSAVGVDTLNGNSDTAYGDLYMPLSGGTLLVKAFVDVIANRNGLITALDQTTGRLFQYDKLGNLLFIFGGIGDQNGLFKVPSSIGETSDGVIHVADRVRGRIDRFYATPFATKVHAASQLYVDGRYQQSLEPWQEVLRMNSNYDLAYFAIGKALYRQQNYKEAMVYFKEARAQSAYSDALFQYRRVYVKENFTVMMTALIALCVLFRLGLLARKKRWFVRTGASRQVQPGARKEQG